jgi:hypothetical protein
MLVLLALAGVVGCGKSPSAVVDQLPGSWQGEVQVNEAGITGLGAEEVATLRQMRLELDFRPDGKLILKGENKGQPYTSQAHWELVGMQGNTITIKTTEDAEEGPQEKLVDFHFFGKDDFVMPLKTERADLGSMKFKRLR